MGAGHYGRYGGRYVAETLIPALEQLERAWADASADAAFQAELTRLLQHYVGRPTSLYHATRLSEDVGATVWLKREDLAHTGAHKINNTIGQVLLAKRMNKPRVIAETRRSGARGRAQTVERMIIALDPWQSCGRAS